jgi:succinyl-CoA synthetase alpha subunit
LIDWLAAVDRGVIVQGLTGRAARIHTRRMRAYGTSIVAGVVPGRAGQEFDGIPIFNTVRDAIDATEAVTTVGFLPPEAAGDGLMEAAEAGIRLGVSLSEGVHTHDTLLALAVARAAGMRVIGPNTPGILAPGRWSVGFLPSEVARAGHCAVLSRSGTLSYEVVFQLSQAGIGQSIWVVVGGDRVKGSRFADIIPLLADDGATRSLVLIGEIGGSDEEDAAPLLRELRIPTVAIIAGRHAPADRQMGHAGALIAGGAGTYASKAEALGDAGVTVVVSPSEIAGAIRRLAQITKR